MPLPNRDMTDWERVKREYDSEAPVAYNPNDPDDGPYDPNDDAAVEAYFAQATIWMGCPPNQILIQKDGVPVHPDGTPRIVPAEDSAADDSIDRPKAKAS